MFGCEGGRSWAGTWCVDLLLELVFWVWDCGFFMLYVVWFEWLVG